MTNEKAIEQLKIARCAFGTPEMRGAFEKAIEALNQEPCEDAVNRARVLSMAIYHQYNTKQASSISKDDVIKNWDDMIDFVENLPSAQPIKPKE